VTGQIEIRYQGISLIRSQNPGDGPEKGEAMSKINPEAVLVLWNDESDEVGVERGHRITEVFVCENRHAPTWSKRLSSSAGACNADWFSGLWRTTPIGLFLQMAVVDEFASRAAKVQALTEFTKIEQQDWASDLLRALGAEPPAG